MLASSARITIIGGFLSCLLGMATPHEPRSSAEPLACTPVEECCKVCDKGKACGNSCIRDSYTCHKGRGCACNAEEICE